MSAPGTFGDIFVQACHATPSTRVATVYGARTAPDAKLAIFGAGDKALVFTSRDVRFMDTAGTARAYSWQELDFVLPGDLSLAGDKLYTFCDLDIPASRIGRIIGYPGALVAIGLPLYIVGSNFAVGLDNFGARLHAGLGILGDILVIIIALVLALVGLPIVLATAAGIFSRNGLLSRAAGWIDRLVRPAIRGLLSLKYGGFQNGLCIMGAKWVSLPWGTPTTHVIDLVMIGIKLRRRGIV